MDFWKFVWGSVVAGIAIAAIPPSFQLATAVLENVKSKSELQSKQQAFNAELQSKQQAFNAELQTKQQAFRDEYVRGFVANALDQDIELRIRLAQYFAKVTTDSFRQGWAEYRDDLMKRRTEIREKIDEKEAELQGKAQDQPQEVERLERNLQWMYKEVGYVERNRSVLINPRARPQDEFNK